MQRLVDMLSTGSVKASDYLVSNPFSTISNERLDGSMSEDIFFHILYVTAFKHYERISKILEIAQDSCQNTIFITGFRGCGKTTFANFLVKLINSELELSEYNRELLESISEKELVNTFQELFKIYRIKQVGDEQSIENNINALSNKDYDYLHGKLNEYKNYINENITGKAIYLNFERGVSELHKPFEQKLNSNLKKLIARIINLKRNTDVMRILMKVYDQFGLTTLEKKDSYFIKDFFDYATKNITYAANSEEVRNGLNSVIASLETDQLMALILLFDLANMEVANDNNRIYYIFDNIDIIFDTKILDNFVQNFACFAESISDLLANISDKNIFSRGCSFHRDFCFIFVMRETSTMLITDHFNDRLRKLAVHFDISSDVDKGLVINKKFEFLEKQPILNPSLKFLRDTVRKVNALCDDQYIKDNIFTMFNNDFKRAVLCLTPICEDQYILVNEFLKIKDMQPDYCKHGARGIIFRLIFNHFDQKSYFQQIGVSTPLAKRLNFTVSRLILLFLNAKQYDHNDAFIFDDRDRISLVTLFDAMKDILSDNEKSALDIFLNSLLGMYNLRISDSWSHLVTFDSIKSMSVDDIRMFMNTKNSSNSEYINVRITCSGRNYIRFISSHFEFFSMRFAKNSIPLFSYSNGDFDTRTKKYKFEAIIESVFNATARCCKNLKTLVSERYIGKLMMSKEELLESPEYLYVNKDKNYSLLHEERYIHQHITYIDAYRLFLINGRFKDNVVDINQRLLPYISKYISLLRSNELFSDISKTLAYELDECTSYIREKQKHSCNNTEISRNSYKQLISKGLIKGEGSK